MRNNSRFARGSGVYAYCYEEAGLENAFSDGTISQAEFDAKLATLKAVHGK